MTELDPTAVMYQGQPFAETLGLRDVVASPERVEASIRFDRSLCTGGGIMHGGVLMGLADAVGGYCAYLNLPPTASGTATIESKTNFLRAVRSGTVMGQSTRPRRPWWVRSGALSNFSSIGPVIPG